MRNNIISENELNNLFDNDQLSCSPDPNIETRLDYAFIVKSKQHKVYQNSLLDGLGWLFSFKYIPLKAAFVSLILAFSLFNFQQKSYQHDVPTVDSSMFIVPFELDSASISPFSADSCYSKT